MYPLLAGGTDLQFPSRLPGFDPAHPASIGLTIGRGASVACLGGGPNLTNLLNGKPLTIAGTTTYTAGQIGPSAGSSSSAGILKLTINNTTPTTVTMAAIFQLTVNSTGNNQIINWPGNDLAVNGAGWLLAVGNGNVGIGLGPVPTAGQPCFVAVSAQSLGTVNTIAVRLDTGQVLNSFSGSCPRSWQGTGTTLAFANASTGAAPLNGTIAAAMVAYNYLTLASLTLWSDDPWAFWYPHTVKPTIFRSLTPGAPPIGADISQQGAFVLA